MMSLRARGKAKRRTCYSDNRKPREEGVPIIYLTARSAGGSTRLTHRRARSWASPMFEWADAATLMGLTDHPRVVVTEATRADLRKSPRRAGGERRGLPDSRGRHRT